MCTCTHAYVEARRQCQMSFSRTLSAFFETEAPTGLVITDQTGLIGDQGAPREPPESLLSLPPRTAGDQTKVLRLAKQALQ